MVDSHASDGHVTTAMMCGEPNRYIGCIYPFEVLLASSMSKVHLNGFHHDILEHRLRYHIRTWAKEMPLTILGRH